MITLFNGDVYEKKEIISLLNFTKINQILTSLKNKWRELQDMSLDKFKKFREDEIDNICELMYEDLQVEESEYQGKKVYHATAKNFNWWELN